MQRFRKGLPVDGLWRQHIALYDMNADGMLDIVVRRRKARGEQSIPHIFVFDIANNLWQEGALFSRL